MSGVDTIGGVRVPAAYCGIMGFRPSHGAVPHMGIIPVSTSLDTVGMSQGNFICFCNVKRISLPLHCNVSSEILNFSLILHLPVSRFFVIIYFFFS